MVKRKYSEVEMISALKQTEARWTPCGDNLARRMAVAWDHYLRMRGCAARLPPRQGPWIQANNGLRNRCRWSRPFLQRLFEPLSRNGLGVRLPQLTHTYKGWAAGQTFCNGLRNRCIFTPIGQQPCVRTVAKHFLDPALTQKTVGCSDEN
jgi:hypothetical protein